MPDKIKVLQEIETGPGKYATTIELVGETVTGKGKNVPKRHLLLFLRIFFTKGTNRREAKQDACRLAFLNILKIDWDRASQGRK